MHALRVICIKCMYTHRYILKYEEVFWYNYRNEQGKIKVYQWDNCLSLTNSKNPWATVGRTDYPSCCGCWFSCSSWSVCHCCGIPLVWYNNDKKFKHLIKPLQLIIQYSWMKKATNDKEHLLLTTMDNNCLVVGTFAPDSGFESSSERWFVITD